MMPLRKVALIALFCSCLPAAGKLDALHVDGAYIRDSSNRVVVLRGVVTLTQNNDGKPMTLTPEDYARIQAWGFNVQQIRLESCRLGLLPPCTADPAYLGKLESMVDMAEAKGIYTIFKAATYDVPGLDFTKQFQKGAWDKIWDTNSGYQERFIDGWKAVWRRFKGRSAVVGYDLMNEPLPGSNTPGFTHNRLFPFYRQALAALRKIDAGRFFLFQPPLFSGDALEPLGGENVLYAPHFYGKVRNPEPQFQEIVRGAEIVQAPMLIGEYGLPNVPLHTATFDQEAFTPERDMADAALFDRGAISTIKTWYTSVGLWSLLMPDGAENPRLQYFSRPYPQRTAGVPKGGFAFDFSTHAWNYAWEADAGIKAPTEIYVPLKRHYAGGFKIAAGESVQLETDSKSAGGLKALGKTKRKDAALFRYDFGSEILTVGAGVRSVRIVDAGR
jgi:hypothetical protein